MTEILWHGRGGQGAFTAAKLLGAAFCLRDNNSFALAFPSFGPERRGAPIRAFTKLDTSPIGDRSETGKADFVIFLDDTLFSTEAFDSLKPSGKILINTKKSFGNELITEIDGDTLAMQTLKRPITNTIMLGALSSAFDGISEQNIEDAVRLYMPQKIQQKNIAAIKAAAALAGGNA